MVKQLAHQIVENGANLTSAFSSIDTEYGKNETEIRIGSILSNVAATISRIGDEPSFKKLLSGELQPNEIDHEEFFSNWESGTFHNERALLEAETLLDEHPEFAQYLPLALAIRKAIDLLKTIRKPEKSL